MWFLTSFLGAIAIGFAVERFAPEMRASIPGSVWTLPAITQNVVFVTHARDGRGRASRVLVGDPSALDSLENIQCLTGQIATWAADATTGSWHASRRRAARSLVYEAMTGLGLLAAPVQVPFDLSGASPVSAS